MRELEFGEEMPFDGRCQFGLWPTALSPRCPRPATVHLLWDRNGSNSDSCTKHAIMAGSYFPPLDAHPLVEDCSDPASVWQYSWVTPPGFCFSPALAEEAASLASVEMVPSG